MIRKWYRDCLGEEECRKRWRAFWIAALVIAGLAVVAATSPNAKAEESAEHRQMLGYCLLEAESTSLAESATDTAGLDAAFKRFGEECEDRRKTPIAFPASELTVHHVIQGSGCSITVYSATILAERRFTAYPLEEAGTACPRR